VSGFLTLRNRQQSRTVNLRFLRRMTMALVEELSPIESFDLGVYLVGSVEMTRLNESFLRHQGSTDVITFDYSETSTNTSRRSNPPIVLHGETFVCVDEAIRQARKFKTTWQSEVTRYLVHGLLHLQGHDDVQPAARRKMKLKENQLLRKLARQLDLAKISARHK